MRGRRAGQVAELEYAYGLGPYGKTRVGSSPTLPTLWVSRLLKATEDPVPNLFWYGANLSRGTNMRVRHKGIRHVVPTHRMVLWRVPSLAQKNTFQRGCFFVKNTLAWFYKNQFFILLPLFFFYFSSGSLVFLWLRFLV